MVNATRQQRLPVVNPIDQFAEQWGGILPPPLWIPRSAPQVAGSQFTPMTPQQRTDRMGSFMPYGGTTQRQAAVPGLPAPPEFPTDLSMNISRQGPQAMIGNDPVTNLRAQTAGLLLPPGVRDPYGGGGNMAPGAYGGTTQGAGGNQFRPRTPPPPMDLSAATARGRELGRLQAGVRELDPRDVLPDEVNQVRQQVGGDLGDQQFRRGLPTRMVSSPGAGGVSLMYGGPQQLPPPPREMRAAGPDGIIGPTSSLPLRRAGEPVPAGTYGDISSFSPEMLDEARQRGRARYSESLHSQRANLTPEQQANRAGRQADLASRRQAVIDRAMSRDQMRRDPFGLQGGEGGSDEAFDRALMMAAMMPGNPMAQAAGQELGRRQQGRAEVGVQRDELEARKPLFAAQAREAAANAALLGRANPEHTQFMETYGALVQGGMNPKMAWQEAGRMTGHTPGQAAGAPAPGLPTPPAGQGPAAGMPAPPQAPLTPFDMISDASQIRDVVRTLGPDTDMVAELRRRGATDEMIRQYALNNSPTWLGSLLETFPDTVSEILGQSPEVTRERRRGRESEKVRKIMRDLGMPEPPPSREPVPAWGPEGWLRHLPGAYGAGTIRP